MKIKKTVLKNVKSFLEETSIEFNDDLNIFIGPNAGGKSNLFEILQGVFNDLIFKNINILKNDNPNRKKPYEIQKRGKNNQIIQEIILEKYYQHENKEQKITLFLKIESEDIQNLETFRENKDKIISFERQQTGNNFLGNLLNDINFQANFKSLINDLIEIEIANWQIVEPQNVNGKPYKDFFIFLRNSNIFANFVNFYNLLNETKIDFHPYLIYISPYRSSIQIGQIEPWINLSQNVEPAFLKQENFNQNTNFSVWDLVKRKLVENYFLGRKKNNEFFDKYVKDFLGINYAIECVRKLDNVFRIDFYKQDKAHSPKLSSGEKELLNIISAVFINEIKSGVFLVDEPELHLHPKWQKLLIDLFTNLSESQKLQFLLVTHSPQFITTKTIKNTFRVYKDKNNISRVIIPANGKMDDSDIKDIFLIVNSLNNERIFFADKVILVEGIVDRIIFEKILKILQEKENNKEIIEIVEVNSKDNFEKFKQFLMIWKIKNYIIADLDYLADIGDDRVKNLFTPNYKRMKKTLDNKNSKDAKTLLKLLNKIITKNKEELTDEDFENLKQLYKYIVSRHISLKESITNTERNEINKYIQSCYPKKIFILKEGSIEDYFDGGHFDIKKAIAISQKIEEGKTPIPTEFGLIFNKIFQDR